MQATKLARIPIAYLRRGAARTRQASSAEGRDEIYAQSDAMRRYVAGDEGSVVKMVSIAATLGIGIFVISEIFNATPQPTNPDMATAFNETQSNTGSAFQLGAIIPLVLAAVVILAYIMGIGRGGGA